MAYLRPTVIRRRLTDLVFGLTGIGAIEKKSDRITPAEVLDVCIKVVAHNRKQMQAWGLE